MPFESRHRFSRVTQNLCMQVCSCESVNLSACSNVFFKLYGKTDLQFMASQFPFAVNLVSLNHDFVTHGFLKYLSQIHPSLVFMFH